MIPEIIKKKIIYSLTFSCTIGNKTRKELETRQVKLREGKCTYVYRILNVQMLHWEFLDIKVGSEKTLGILERDSNAKDRSRALSISNFADLTQF